jgi:hypothetical protein
MHYSLLIRSRKKPAVVRTNVGVAPQPKIELKGSIVMVTRLSRGFRLSDEKRERPLTVDTPEVDRID